MTSSYYLHIPFCRQKCPYCKFALTPIFDEAKKRRYLAYLEDEISRYSVGSPIRAKTIYFGGGTPSILTYAELSRLLNLFHIDDLREITFEANPEDITLEYAIALKNLGITRISLGVQSLNDSTLTTISRSRADTIFQTLKYLQEAGHTNINVDFIIGLPYSHSGDTLRDIKALHAQFPNITHTSVYLLEDGHYPRKWESYSMSPEEMKSEYRDVAEYFASIGWNHYEISNWAKPGYESVHNQGYWNHTNIRGFGLAAASYEGGRRFENSPSFAGYYRGERVNEETLTEIQLYIESVMFGLRTFSLPLNMVETKKLSSPLESGFVREEFGKIILTSTGIFHENSIISELI